MVGWHVSCRFHAVLLLFKLVFRVVSRLAFNVFVLCAGVEACSNQADPPYFPFGSFTYHVWPS